MIVCEITAYALDITADHHGNGIVLRGHNAGILEMIIVLAIVVILDSTITFLVIILFFTKLKHLILAKQRQNRMISGAEIEMNDTQQLFVNKAVKHALLCLISFGTTQFVWYYSLILFLSNDGELWAISYFIILFNGLITVMCIFFTYKFNDDPYYKCCSRCHMCLFTKCRKMANKTLASNPIAGLV